MISNLPFNVSATPIPVICTWKGDTASTLYWDDPNNWKDGVVPNGAEATAIFPSLSRKTITVVVRGHIALANIWFDSQSTSYELRSEGAEEESILYFVTGQPLANIVLTERNSTDHMIPLMIMHSCKSVWGPGWKSAKALNPDDRPPQSKITFSGDIGSYKPTRRASLILDGYLTVALTGRNSFVGPIELRRGELDIATSLSIPSGTVVEIYEPARINLRPGVEARIKALKVNGKELPNGLYISTERFTARDRPASANVLDRLLGTGTLLVDSAMNP